MTNQPLTVSTLTRLGMLAEAVERKQPITRLLPDGNTVTKVARAFTHDGGGFLGRDDDVRDAFVWVSGMTEEWWPVSELLDGIREGAVALNYRP
jgi:hypothetical protein